MTEKKNEVIVLTGKGLAEELLPNLFSDINFGGLNAAIDKMGESSHQLDLDEKQMAIGIIEDWNSNVVKRLGNKEQDMNVIEWFFKENYQLNLGHMSLREFGDDLARKTDTLVSYNAMQQAEKELQASYDSKPEAPIKDTTTTLEEQIKEGKEHEAAVLLYDIKHAKLQKLYNSSVIKWKRALLETDVVKDLLVSVRKQKRAFSKFYAEADDKTQLAKMSISISSSTARDALKELFKFSTTI